MMDKKAQSTLMVALIAFLAAALVALMLFAVVIPALQESGDKNLCKMSVAAKYMAGVAEFKTEANVKLVCYTQTLEIRNDGIYKSGKKRKPERIVNFASDIAYLGAEGSIPASIDEISSPVTGAVPYSPRQQPAEYGLLTPELRVYTDDELNKVLLVKRAIANEMYYCWDQFFEGKAPIFYGREKRCVICSDIKFQDGWLGEKSHEPIVIGKFLNEVNIPGKDITYATYLGGRWEDDFVVNPLEKTQVVFKGVGRDWLDNWIIAGSTIFGCTLGIIGGGLVIAASAAGGPLTLAAGIAGGIAIAGAGCTIGGAVGTGEAFIEGEDWVATIVVGPTTLVAGESCDRLY